MTETMTKDELEVALNSLPGISYDDEGYDRRTNTIKRILAAFEFAEAETVACMSTLDGMTEYWGAAKTSLGKIVAPLNPEWIAGYREWTQHERDEFNTFRGLDDAVDAICDFMEEENAV